LDDFVRNCYWRIIECFRNEPPQLHSTFNSFTDGEKKAYIDWIYAAKTATTKAKRIVKMMEKLEKGLKFYDKEGL
ncbi:MAG: YdeI/OmpD-associated family protein, partial [Bacteroidota bacterium]